MKIDYIAMKREEMKYHGTDRVVDSFHVTITNNVKA